MGVHSLKLKKKQQMPKYISITTTSGGAAGKTAYINVDHIVDVRQDTTTETKILLNVATPGSACIQVSHNADGGSSTSTRTAIRAAIEEAVSKNTKPRQVFPVVFPHATPFISNVVSASDAVIP